MKKSKILLKNNIYLIGIGGISMSGLAKILKNLGAVVSGSDISQNEEVEKLKKLGIKIYPKHDKDNITKDIDLVVFTGAIKSDNPEIIKAKELNIRVIERSEFLGLISKNFKNIIAIAGTHGKTTTTAMIGKIFKDAGLNPTIHIGGNSIDLGGNTIIGNNKYFIVEACEYRNSFQYLYPNLSVITNIESDHLDFYINFENLCNAFQSFADNSKSIIIDKKVKITHKSPIKVGIDYKVKNVVFNNGGYDFDIYKNDKKWLTLRLNMIGKYNIDNVTKAVIVADYYNIDKNIIQSSVSSFKGVERRNQIIGEINETKIIIDYAHHPTEIKCCIDGINEVYKNPLYIFQPHTYSRTLTLFNDFIKVFKNIDNLIIFKTYPAREEKISGGDGVDLHLHLNNSLYADSLSDVVDYIYENNRLFDCVVILGAGNLAIEIKNVLFPSI